MDAVEEVEMLREILRQVVDSTYYVQFDDHICSETVKFASKIHHLALEGDIDRTYYAPRKENQETIMEANPALIPFDASGYLDQGSGI